MHSIVGQVIFGCVPVLVVCVGPSARVHDFRSIYQLSRYPAICVVGSGRAVRAPMAHEDAFELAAALVAQPPEVGGEHGEDGLGLGPDFDVAAGLMVAPLADVPLGLPPRSKATAAFARQHLATKRAEAKASELKAKLDNLTERRCLRLVRGLN